MILIEMLPNLYLGDLESIKYKGQIDVTHTINCVKDLKTIGNNSEYVFNIKKNIEQYEIVKMYQYLISPFFPSTCKFSPSCSKYGIDAINKYGALKGSLTADDSTIIVDGTTGAITAPSYVQFGSFTTPQRNAFSKSSKGCFGIRNCLIVASRAMKRGSSGNPAKVASS